MPAAAARAACFVRCLPPDHLRHRHLLLRRQIPSATTPCTRYCEQEDAEPDERQLQAALLSFLREILSVAPQQALRIAAADGSALDGLRAASFDVADALSRDTLRATADLPNRELVAKRLLMCRADALGRICAEAPTTPTTRFLAAAYECRTLREFLLTPQAPHGTFGDAAWLAPQRLENCRLPRPRTAPHRPSCTVVGLAYAPQSAASAAWRLTVASVARVGAAPKTRTLPLAIIRRRSWTRARASRSTRWRSTRCRA